MPLKTLIYLPLSPIGLPLIRFAFGYNLAEFARLRGGYDQVLHITSSVRGRNGIGGIQDTDKIFIDHGLLLKPAGGCASGL